MDELLDIREAGAPRMQRGHAPQVDLPTQATHCEGGTPNPHPSDRRRRMAPARASGLPEGGPAMSSSKLPPVSQVLLRLQNVRKTENGWTALCPAHEDTRPSLSIGVGNESRVLLYCFAGCSLSEILETLA